MDKPIHVGFAILDLSKLHMYVTYYDKIQPYFGQENIQLHHVDTDGMILSMKTKIIIIDWNNLKYIIDFSNLDKNHELFSNENKDVIGKFKMETPKTVIIDEFVCLKSKLYAFESGEESKNKTKGISESYSKNNKFEDYKKCLDGEEYERDFENYTLRSAHHEMCLQKKLSLSIFDDKRNYSTNIKSLPGK